MGGYRKKCLTVNLNKKDKPPQLRLAFSLLSITDVTGMRSDHQLQRTYRHLL